MPRNRINKKYSGPSREVKSAGFTPVMCSTSLLRRETAWHPPTWGGMLAAPQQHPSPWCCLAPAFSQPAEVSWQPWQSCSPAPVQYPGDRWESPHQSLQKNSRTKQTSEEANGTVTLCLRLDSNSGENDFHAQKFRFPVLEIIVSFGIVAVTSQVMHLLLSALIGRS